MPAHVVQWTDIYKTINSFLRIDVVKEVIRFIFCKARCYAYEKGRGDIFIFFEFLVKEPTSVRFMNYNHSDFCRNVFQLR